MSETYITKTELASVLAMSERWIETQMKDGLPHLKLGRAVRFKLSEVVEWIAAA